MSRKLTWALVVLVLMLPVLVAAADQAAGPPPGRPQVWQVNKLHSLLLTNLGLRSSVALTTRLFNIQPSIPFTAVKGWIVLGPIPPVDLQNSDSGPSALARVDLTELATHHAPAYRRKTARGAQGPPLLVRDHESRGRGGRPAA